MASAMGSNARALCSSCIIVYLLLRTNQALSRGTRPLLLLQSFLNEPQSVFAQTFVGTQQNTGQEASCTTSPCCTSWDGPNYDEWWVHHPTWIISSDDESGFCFSNIIFSLDFEGVDLQGRDISKEIYLGRNKSLETLKRDDWYYEFTTDHAAGATATAVVGKRYKYIKWLRVQFEQLFDLKEDPKELHDIGKSPKHQSVLEMMRVRHDELRAEVLKPCISDTPCDINSGLFNHSKFIELFHSGETLTQYEPL